MLHITPVTLYLGGPFILYALHNFLRLCEIQHHAYISIQHCIFLIEL